jgi:hypothetical protein
MGKLYSIAIVNKEDLRETKLLQIFGDGDYGSTYVGSYELNLTTSGYIEKGTSFKARTYKTVNGAQRFINTWTKKNDEKEIRLIRSTIINGQWTYKFKFEKSKLCLVVVDITDTWNNLIDNDIQRITRLANNKILMLNKKRV